MSDLDITEESLETTEITPETPEPKTPEHEVSNGWTTAANVLFWTGASAAATFSAFGAPDFDQNKVDVTPMPDLPGADSDTIDAIQDAINDEIDYQSKQLEQAPTALTDEVHTKLDQDTALSTTDTLDPATATQMAYVFIQSIERCDSLSELIEAKAAINQLLAQYPDISIDEVIASQEQLLLDKNSAEFRLMNDYHDKSLLLKEQFQAALEAGQLDISPSSEAGSIYADIMRVDDYLALTHEQARQISTEAELDQELDAKLSRSIDFVKIKTADYLNYGEDIIPVTLADGTVVLDKSQLDTLSSDALESIDYDTYYTLMMSYLERLENHFIYTPEEVQVFISTLDAKYQATNTYVNSLK